MLPGLEQKEKSIYDEELDLAYKHLGQLALQKKTNRRSGRRVGI